MARRGRRLLEADAFRARVKALRNDVYADWTDWEADWLDDEARRREDYIYTDNEWAILHQLIASATTFFEYSGWTIQEMLEAVYSYRKDLDEDSEEFVENLYKRQATELRVRQVSRLANLCRLSESVERDEIVDAVLREIRGKDDTDRYKGDAFRHVA
jgi:hypothetical protein